MASILVTLVFGVLAGIAGLTGAAPFETVLMLGVLGLTHMMVVAERREREAALVDSSAKPGA